MSFDVRRARPSASSGRTAPARSTTISMLCTADPVGWATPGRRLRRRQRQTEVRRRIGLVFQDTTLDDYLTAEENLRFHAELYGVATRSVAERLERVMEMVGLWERRKSLVRTFSGGMKRRLEIARGLLHSPAGAVPRRADRRPRPPDPGAHLGLHQRAEEAGGDHHVPDHPLHGRSRELRPHRHHRRRRRSCSSTRPRPSRPAWARTGWRSRPKTTEAPSPPGSSSFGLEADDERRTGDASTWPRARSSSPVSSPNSA